MTASRPDPDDDARAVASAITRGQADALSSIDVLAGSVESAGLLSGAVAAGLLARCGEGTHPADLAAAMGVDTGLMGHVCTALGELGVLRALDDGRVTVSRLCAPLLEDGLTERVLDRLAAARARAGVLEAALDPARETSYWSLDSETRRAIAQSATARPDTAFGRDAPVTLLRAIPEWEQAFARGGRFLDVGCGVGGQILSYLLHFPALTAVGLDRADDLLEVARGRARDLGVAERARFVHVDAGEFRDPEPFDVVFWPQLFFAGENRKQVLETIFTSLAPGGLLVTIVAIPPAPEAGDVAGLNLGRRPSLDPVLRSLWGVPERSAEQVKAELGDAGFLAIEDGPAPPLITPQILARRPE